ncbi:PASTA domain-containing protein [Nonomuraea guangzhouensis]|nr:PASTA domain-containing protein [Nonomuraea guangzhouensis]
MSWPDGVPSVEADVREVAMRAYAVAASVMVLMAAILIGPVSPAMAGAGEPTSEPVVGGSVTPTASSSCPTLDEWNSETHDGTHEASVPNVMGMTRENAKATLAQAGFDTEATPSDAAADWTVTDQTPTSEELANCGSTVTIDLEAPTVEVPDVVGDPLDQAEQEVRDQGLVSSVAQGEAAEPRVVDSQDPAAGTRVPKGSTVTLRLRPPAPVSPTPEQVAVPDLSGLSASAARRRVQERGLTLVIGSGDSGSGGSVSEQEPAAGSLVERGSSVTVTLTPVTGPTDPASPEVTPTDTDESPEAGAIDTDETGSSSTPLPILLVAVLVAAAVLVWALRRARRGRGTPAMAAASAMPDMTATTVMPATSAPPPAASVVCVPYADLSPRLELRELVAPSLSLDFVCHHDQGRQEIREIVR